MKKIAIFASGAGSNAKKLVEHFRDVDLASIALIVSNNPSAGVVKIARSEIIPVLLIEKKWFKETGYINELRQHGIDFIVLAGFLWKVPAILIERYPEKIVNIHPALLPSYGGKGMYGNAVHLAVINAKEKESGITIHFVDEKYDNGKIISQVRCPVDYEDTPESLAEKIHLLEHEHYPVQVEKIIREQQ